MSAPVAVCADASPGGRRALRFAAAEARRRETTLQVLVTDREPAGDVFARAMTAVRAAVPGLPVLAHAVEGPARAGLRALSADAQAVVVPTGTPGLADIVADSFCPVLVVPADAPETERGPVVLGVAPWTGEEVVDLAFVEAARRRAELLAVRTWTDSRIDLGWLRPGRVRHWDEAESRARRELETALAAWAVAHPTVKVNALVAEDDAGDLLVALSHRARLLVLGRSTRGALLGGLAASPVTELAAGARCPLLVVPAEGPPRRTWLPGGGRGLVDTSG